MNDTIFALASGAGPAAIAVLRMSGASAGAILTGLSAAPLPPARQATLRRLADAAGEPLDQSLVLWMPAPRSYTGEDVAELHVHAGPAVIDGVTDRLVSLGARPAEPGEFSRRAFLNGRIGLTEAEAVADLIEAESAAQRVQAMRQLEGRLTRIFEDWTESLTFMLAQAEAALDFPEEAETVFDGADVCALIAAIEAQMDDDHGGERVRAGFRIAVVGPPNAGKSSLVNGLTRRDAAIVSPVAGTTRDVIDVPAVIAGVKVSVMDTAGLRETSDAVEAEGMRRARACADAADMVLFVQAADQAQSAVPAGWIGVTSKIDLGAAHAGTIGASAVQTGGLEALRRWLEAEMGRLSRRAGPAPLTRARHRAACRDACVYLREALATEQPELRAEEMRLAVRALGRVTGRVEVDDVLDAVFSQFCIGK